MRVAYERDMTHNYLIPQTEQKLQDDDYRVHMLMENQIRGLLPCVVQKKDGQEEFRYDITSRQSLEQIYSGRNMSEPEIRLLLQGLLQTLIELKKYLLDAAMLILEPQMIYMDVETREPVFCYLPGYGKEITESFRELTFYILQHLQAFDQQTVFLGYRIYRESQEENYCLERLLKQAAVPEDRDGGGRQKRNVYSHIEYQSEWEEKNYDLSGKKQYCQQEVNQRERPDLRREKRSSREMPRETDEKIITTKDEEEAEWSDTEEYVEAEDRREKASRGAEAKTNQAYHQKKQQQKLEMRKKKAQKKKEKVQQKIEKTTHQKPKSKGKKKQENAEKEQKFSGKTFLIICFVLAVLMTLAAAWFWKLSTTQTGGILFLLIGLMAYGCSMEPKKVSAKQEEVDYESYGLEEQPYIIEETEPEEEKISDTYESRRNKRECPAHEDPYIPSTQELSGKSKDYRQWRNYEKSEVQSFSENRERFGNTAVLYEDEPSETLLTLTRINSREPEHIVLLQDQYMVGKLSMEADLVIRDSSVSRVHAKIQRIDGQYILCDLNSTNGTFLNERRLMIQERVLIQPGDKIAFARAEYQVGRY